MNNLLPGLLDNVIRMSATGGALILLLLLARKLSARKTAVNKFNAKWNYRASILVMLFMLVPLNAGFLLRNVRLPSFNPAGFIESKFISEKNAANIENTYNIGFTAQTQDEYNIINAENPIYEPDDIPLETEADTDKSAEKTKAKATLNYKFIFSVIYLSGLLIFSAKKTAGYLKFRKFLKNSSAVLTDERILSLYKDCAAELAIKRHIAFYSNNNISSPMTSGLLKPAVYLPDLPFDADEMRLILKHELIHVKRKDLWYKFAVSIVRAVHWFNPLCILFEKNVDLLCELSCDELIIENMGRQERKFYCETIINTVRRLTDENTKPDGVYAAISSGGKQMERRFSHMLNYKKTTVVNIIISVSLIAGIFAFGVFASALISDRANPSPGGFVTLPVDADNIASIYAGSMVTGAIDSEGKVYMWGNNSYGQCDVPDGLPPIKDLGIGAQCVIALDINGKLHGWGTNEYQAMDFVGQEDIFVDVDAESYHTAAVSEDGKVYKWGEANQGSQEFVPKDLPFIVSVQCNSYCTTVIDIDGKVHMWGLLSRESANFSINVKTKKAAMAATLAWDTIILQEDGKIYGEVPHKNYNYKYKPQPDIENITAIYGGCETAAAIDNEGKVYIWGEYDYNPGMSSIIDVPESLPPVIQVALGCDKVTVLGEDGRIYEWSGASYEMLKDIDMRDISCATRDLSPVEFSGSANVNTADELYEAVQNKIKDIYVKADMTIDHDFSVENGQTLHIAKDVILTVSQNTMNFNIYGTGNLVNDGRINVYGRICFDKEPAKLGVVASFKGGVWGRGEIFYNGGDLTFSEIKRLLSGDLPYNSIAASSDIIIDEDYTLETDKTIWLKGSLKVAKGATLTVKGTFEMYKQQPVIEGTVVGDIKVYE